MPTMFEIVVGEDELIRELTELAHYWPFSLEDLREGQPYPPVAVLSRACLVIVAGDAVVH